MLAGLDAIGGFVSGSSSGGGTSGSLVVTVSSTSKFKTASSKSTGTVVLTTSSVTATVSGGAGGETYAWTRVSGDAGVTALTPTAAITNFRASLTPASDEKEAQFICTVTDSAGAVAVSEIVDADLQVAFL